MRYPEVIGFDVTNGVNQEKRPLGKGTLINASGKNVPFFNAFLPSQCRWVFVWIRNQAIPSLLPKEYLKKTRLVITDEDDNCYDMLEGAKENFPNHIHRLCKWHNESNSYKNVIWTNLNIY